tara:strand:- start:340 stop:585 length:246 start_codon:yes stop_codon:yes gene_type:complete
MKSYKIYAKATCGYCRALLQTMMDKNICFYTEFLDESPELLQEKKTFYNHKTVPIVILRENGKETLIGGCDDTLEFLKKEK